MRRASAPLASVALVAVLAVSREAAAFERQWHAGAGLGLAKLGDEAFGDAGVASAKLTYGLTDAFDALVRVDASRHGSGTHVYAGAAGLAYTFDVLRWVPWAGALGGAYRLDVPGAPATAPGVQLALGLDYAVTRKLSLGGELRWHTIFAPDPLGRTSLTTATLGAAWAWGF